MRQLVCSVSGDNFSGDNVSGDNVLLFHNFMATASAGNNVSKYYLWKKIFWRNVSI